MSDTLNALIAFAGFLMLFSMLVTSVQEGLKNLLNLKTGVWERFFVNIYKHDFGLDTTAVADGTTYRERMRVPFVGEYEKRLKRLRDMLVEAEEPFKKIGEILENIIKIDPKSADAAQEIATHLLPLKDALLKVKGLRLDSLLDMYDRVRGFGIKGFYTDIRLLEEKFPVFRGDLQTVKNDAVEEFIGKCRQLDGLIKKFEGMISEYKIQIENKVDAWLAQLNREYKKNMLKWTVIIGLILVFTFNADSFNIFRFLISDTEISKAITSAASETVVSSQKARADVLNTVDKIIGEGKLPEAAEKLAGFLRDIQDDFKALEGTNETEKVASLISKISENNPPERSKLQNIYDQTVPLYVTLQKATLNDHLQGIAVLDMPLGWRREGKRLAEIAGGEEIFFYIFSKLGGLLLTSVLITFGAPFWKDVMNTLLGAKKAIPAQKTDPV